VQFADFGFGTVVGTLITAGVALVIDKRRRTDERKNRFLDDKRRGYTSMILALDIMASIQLLHAEFASLLRKFEHGEELDSEDLKASESLDMRLQQIMERYGQELDPGAIRELSLLGSRRSTEPVLKMLDVIEQMKEHVAAREFEKAGELADEYERAAADLHAAARRDLGTDH
jgi:hypothetical protein